MLKILNHFSISFNKTKILRQLGYQCQNFKGNHGFSGFKNNKIRENLCQSVVTELGIPPVVWQTIEEEIQEAKTLVEPKVVYTDLLIKKIDKKKILFSGCPSESADLLIKSNSLARLLQRGTKATLFLLTIGQELEKRTENLFILGEKTKGLILDAIGSVAADDLAAQLHRLIFLRAKDEGYRVTGRFSPGYGDLSLILQKEILKILKAEKIGVSLTESFMLVPRKSVSGFIGWRKIISCS